MTSTISADLTIVGGGFSGLWSAYLAKKLDPSLDVVIAEATEVASGATGRNGGFCQYSLTHGISHGLSRFAGEFAHLEELGKKNYQELLDDIEHVGIDCDVERTGSIDIAMNEGQFEDLRELFQVLERLGYDAQLFDRETLARSVVSPSYVGGLKQSFGTALIDPAKLAFGLARANRAMGVRIFEQTPVRSLTQVRGAVELRCDLGNIRAKHAIVGTSAYPSPLRRVRPYLAPVYDYVLVTEPLNEQQLASIGWSDREGLSDCGNRFHYYRLTSDNRVLFGGFDAIYHFGGSVRGEYDQRPSSHRVLAEHFFAIFPQLSGVRFTHSWGGAIDTTSRFSAMYGTALGQRCAYTLGYTGLGVAASRFGAQVALELLGYQDTGLRNLDIVKHRPLPFPPEPLKSLAIALTQRSLRLADDHGGKRDRWLRLLDRLGLGFDS